MKKFLTFLLFAIAATSLKAQTDVTATYIANPSFEVDDIASLTAVNNSADGLRGYTLTNPKGWTVTGTSVTELLVTKACYTDNNFGVVTTIADGDKAYYLRMGWSTGATTVGQTVKQLPEGKYMLTADVRSAYANSATSSYKLFAGTDETSGTFEQGSTGYFTTAQWHTLKLTFDVAAEKDINIGVAVNWLSGGSCIMIDNIRLMKLSDEYVEPQEPTEKDVTSLTEGIISSAFVSEETMKGDLLQMLADFATYLKNDFQQAVAPNSVGEACGCFRGENTMGNNEQGVRPNADLSMICAFLAKYGKGKVTLPQGVTWTDIEDMAMKSLVFAYSTHKANKLKVCAGNNYWGSVSTSDYAWESSLWAMSVAYSAFFQWQKLTSQQRNYIYNMLKAECNYELYRNIPTGYSGDTKAEENGWEADILAATLGLFPNDALAPQWFKRLREFAVNSYSHAADAQDNTVIDPQYDQTTIRQLYKGQNLYSDYTLQNHNYFHTSYQNVVMQELGEAALALKLFQKELYNEEKWQTNALMHHNKEVQTEVLNWLALADGELAMPNGNDWSLFLYDQITSYSTNACFLRDADALMLENLAYKYIKARQKTTADGSWLLRADVGARRMGVEAHRVMMTYLMHDALSTADIEATDFNTFRQRYSSAKVFDTQNIVRAYTKDRFTTFSWSAGLSSYTGYFASNTPDKNKIVVPFRANNTGNLLGWYSVSGKNTNATPVVRGIYQLDGDAYVMNGELNTNDAVLNNRFALYSTPGNAIIYIDNVKANSAGTMTREQGGLLAISVDEMTRLARTFYYYNGLGTPEEGNEESAAATITHKQLDGTQLTKFSTPWINIDNELGIITTSSELMAFGDRANNNSVMTAKLYTAYDDNTRNFTTGDVIGRRGIVYYSNIDAETTETLHKKLVSLTEKVPAGWNGLIASDPDNVNYLLLSNFTSSEKCVLDNVETPLGRPVFNVPTTDGKTVFSIEMNNSMANTLKFFVADGQLNTVQEEGNPDVAYFESTADCNCEYVVNVVTKSGIKEVKFTTSGIVKLTIDGDDVKIENAEFPSYATDNLTAGFEDITAETLVNHNFEEDATYGTMGSNQTASGVTYAQCYINNISAINSKWPNLLPVKGWTPSNTLSSGSNFCRMYSMPYSSDFFCVSPTSVGNYAAQIQGMVADDTKGNRVLTVLNSWDAGRNSITQTARLEAGEYRLLIDMLYDCPNQVSNNGRTVTASGNTNTSFTGVKIGTSTTDYRYPSAPNRWEVMVYDFTLNAPTDVTFSLGFQTSASVGAANNTLLYIDNLRLLTKIANGITENIQATDVIDTHRMYNLSGQRITSPQRGIYIMNGKKYVQQ